MDIAFAFDEAYVDHAQVAIESLLECHGHRNNLTLWLATTAEVAAERGCSLTAQVEGRALLRLLIKDDDFREMPAPADGTYPTAVYLRLDLPNLVPPHVHRLLYLDSDILVHGDLGPLWETPLGRAPWAAVCDGINRTMGDWGGVPGMGADVRKDAPYFNSGVLLIDVPKWRRLRVTKRCVEYLYEHRDHLRFPDQDALNLVGYDRWLQLDPSWNDMMGWWRSPTGESDPKHARVTHFIGPRKPWHADFPVAAYRARYLDLAARLRSGSRDRTGTGWTAGGLDRRGC